MRNVGAGKDAVGKAYEAGETERGGDADFRGVGFGLGAELEVALDAQVELFSPVEDISVIIGKLRRNAKQAGGVEGGLQVGLEALQTGIAQGNVTVYLVFRDRLQVDIDPREHTHAGETAVIGVDVVLVIQLAGP